ncbi:MAG: endonuclease/exonuclease/phosphatase family protein [Planctomycetota bacterium]
MHRNRQKQTTVLRAAATLLSATIIAAAGAQAADPQAPAAGVLRVATYNVAMYRQQAGQLQAELLRGDSQQAKRIAEVIQRVRPHVILLNEFDYAAGSSRRENYDAAEFTRRPSELVGALKRLYLERPQAGREPISFQHQFYKPVNTGVDSGLDLDKDGKTGGPADAWGYGRYPGQYGMLLLSQFPIGPESRTYQQMRWRELADPLWPRDPATGEHFYSAEQRRALRLASKSFWDVELLIEQPGARRRPLRLLCAHPTPPGFDGPEDRNGCRNYDEIRMIAEYISGDRQSRFPVDNDGHRSEDQQYGTLAPGADFVVLGDLNADPVDGNGRRGAIQQLLEHPRINAGFIPTSEGGAAASAESTDRNGQHRGDPRHDTADFGGDGYSNLRVDYVLPSRGIKVAGGGVYWPTPGEPGAEAIAASDHRLVWLDLLLPQEGGE